jgi:hypothetical protein
MSETFGLNFQNIPVVNLRLDFVQAYRDALELARRAEACPDFPCDLAAKQEMDFDLNWTLRSSIINLECYVHYAVWDVLGCTQAWTPDKRKTAKNPYGHKKGICGAYYDTLPALVAPELSLRVIDNTLWQRSLALYKEVRNPLFHGKMAYDISPPAYFTVIEHIRLMYKWIDSWHKSSWGDLSCDHLVGANNSFKPTPLRGSA